jgi:outer membrane protein insertion porin family
MLHRISERLGEKPSYFNRGVLITDLILLRNFYRDNGFIDARIDTNVVYNLKDKTVDINFIIKEGKPYRIEQVSIRGLGGIQERLKERALELKFLRPGDVYRLRNVDSEISRILNLLYNNGYPNAYIDRSKVLILIDSTRKTISIDLSFRPNRRFKISGIKIILEDSLRMKISREIIDRELEFKVGQYYNRELILKSEMNLARTGLFEKVKIEMETYSTAQDTGALPAPVRINLLPRNKHDILPAIYLSDERNRFNAGISLNYLNRNFLGDGRFLSLDLRTLLQSFNFKKLPDMNDTTTAGTIEANIKLTQPYLLRKKIMGEWTISAILDKQRQYTLGIIRNRIRLNYNFTQLTNGYLDMDLEHVNSRFQATVDSALIRRYPRQFNSVVTFSIYHDRTNDIFYPTSGFSHFFLIEEAGLIPYLFGNFGAHILPFSQYYKFLFTGRWFWSLNNSVFAIKLKIGYANEYRLKSKRKLEVLPVPIHRKFFAGGSASVRGWRARELGNVPNPEFGGNVLIEMNLEDRYMLIPELNIGSVVFLDIGNLWNRVDDVRINQLAIAAGFGFRYITFFGGFRVDLGFRIYDPGVKSRWIFQKTIREIFKGVVFHIGVGQTF